MPAVSSPWTVSTLVYKYKYCSMNKENCSAHKHTKMHNDGSVGGILLGQHVKVFPSLQTDTWRYVKPVIVFYQ
jgi:hypothetical protein